VAVPSSAPAARLPRSTRANGAIAADGQGDDRLAAERSLLEIARVALVRGQAAGALAALERHAGQFPSGALAEEREGLLVQALVAARQYDRARERAARFNQRYPRSLFAPVVEQALASIPVTERPAGPKQETP
jgi:TolA-binding protein